VLKFLMPHIFMPHPGPRVVLGEMRIRLEEHIKARGMQFKTEARRLSSSDS